MPRQPLPEDMVEPRIQPSAKRHGLVIMGKISGLYGVKGWVKVFSDTQPRENILRYSPWYLYRENAWVRYEPCQGRRHGKTLVTRLAGCDDRDQAAALLGSVIAVPRAQLPETAENEYYWMDLEGLKVTTVAGVSLGTVSHLFSTGANDVIVVRGDKERMIPFVQPDVVTSVDLDGGTMTVDWDPDF